jgi:hypothetical protein
MTFGPELLLIGTVAVVGVLHTVVPDHWVPITLIARQRGWSMAETARASLIAGTGHVVSTLVIALVVWIAGVAQGAKLRQQNCAKRRRLDALQPTWRMRRLYVHRKSRRRKVARANALLQEAAANVSLLPYMQEMKAWPGQLDSAQLLVAPGLTKPTTSRLAQLFGCEVHKRPDRIRLRRDRCARDYST